MDNNTYNYDGQNNIQGNSQENYSVSNNNGEYSLKYKNGVPIAPGYSASEYLPRATSYTPPTNSYEQQSYQEPPRYSYNAPQSEAYSAPVYNTNEQNGAVRAEKSSGTFKTKVKQIVSGKNFRITVACLLLVAICAGVSAITSYSVFNSLSRNNSGSSSTSFGQGSGTASSGNTNYVTGETISPSQIYDMACEQVVGISIMVQTNIFGQTSSSAVSGSGFIISDDGYILTNYHVIEYSAEYGYDITVMLGNGDEYTAKLIGYDDDNDVALLKIEATGLNSVTFGTSMTMQVGESVYIVGNPLGELAYSMTNGIVSALDREITVDSGVAINMFQTNAAVNSGNSGGPVYNSRGEVIGIVTAKYADTGVEGLGFAIPIDDAASIAEQLLEYGYVRGKAYLGVSVVDSSSVGTTGNNNSIFSWGSQQSNGLPDGAYVYSVETGSCAEVAGIKAGDVIIAVGDYEISSVTDLTTLLRRKLQAGDSSTVTVWRGGEEIKLDIVFDEYVKKVTN